MKESDSHILKAINEILHTKHTTLDGVTLKELNRVCLILRISQILDEHPEMAVFVCKPNEVAAEF
jgi:hypothetical protein